MCPDDYNNSAFYVNSVSNRSKSPIQPLIQEFNQNTPSGFRESNLVKAYRTSKDTIRYEQNERVTPTNLFRESDEANHYQDVYATASWPKSPERNQNTNKMNYNRTPNSKYDQNNFEERNKKLRMNYHPKQIFNDSETQKHYDYVMVNTPEISQSDEQSSLMFQNNMLLSRQGQSMMNDNYFNSMDNNVIFPNNSQQIPMTKSFNINMKKPNDKGKYKIRSNQNK